MSLLESPYEPQQDPRYLGPDIEEIEANEEEAEARKRELGDRLVQLARMREVFVLPGWKDISVTLQAEIEAAKDSLIARDDDLRKEDRQRGQIQALQRVLRFPDAVEGYIREAQAELTQLSEQPS